MFIATPTRRAAVVAAAVLAAGMLAGCESREQKCTRDGGVVSSEREFEWKTKRWVTEYECTRGDQEIDEWKA